METYAEIERQTAIIIKGIDEIKKIINDNSISDEVKYKKAMNNALKSTYSYQRENTDINIFTNNKNCNNVVYIGSYSSNSNLSRSSSNNSNGISYGPTLF